MAKIPISFGAGGGGDGSDECTATASDILESKTAIYDGSDDEPAYGSMKDYSGTTSQGDSSLDSTNSRLRLKVPNTGKYDTNAYLYNTYSNIRSLLGISADVIKKGVDILGITGTWEGYITDPGDLYYQGTVGTLGGSMGLYSNDNCTISNDRSCVTMTSKAYTDISSGNYAGINFSTPIDCKDYNELTLTYNETVAPTQSSTSEQNNGIYIALYTSRPTTRDEFYWGNMQYYNAAQPTRNETGSGKTLTLDLSGITGTLYVGVFLSGSYANSGYEWVAEVTRISVS